MRRRQGSRCSSTGARASSGPPPELPLAGTPTDWLAARSRRRRPHRPRGPRRRRAPPLAQSRRPRGWRATGAWSERRRGARATSAARARSTRGRRSRPRRRPRSGRGRSATVEPAGAMAPADSSARRPLRTDRAVSTTSRIATRRHRGCSISTATAIPTRWSGAPAASRPIRQHRRRGSRAAGAVAARPRRQGAARRPRRPPGGLVRPRPLASSSSARGRRRAGRPRARPRQGDLAQRHQRVPVRSRDRTRRTSSSRSCGSRARAPFSTPPTASEMRFVTDILGLAPLGMLAAPGRYVPADPEEYLRLPDWVAARADGGAADHRRAARGRLPRSERAGGGRRAAGSRGLQRRALDSRAGSTASTCGCWGRSSRRSRCATTSGRDVLEMVADARPPLPDALRRRPALPGRRAAALLEIELSPELAATGRVSLVLTGWLHWGNTSTNVARAQDPAGAPLFPYLEVPTGEGGWRRVDLDVGLPAGKTKPVVVDLAGLVNPADPRVRITTDFEVYWDRIAVAETAPARRTPHQHPSPGAAARRALLRRFLALVPAGGERPLPLRLRGPPALSLAADRRAASGRSPGRSTRASTRPSATSPTWCARPTTAWRSSAPARSWRCRSTSASLPPLADGLAPDAVPPLRGLGEGRRSQRRLLADRRARCPRGTMNEHPCPQSETEAALENADRRVRWVDRDRLDRRVLAWNG